MASHIVGCRSVQQISVDGVPIVQGPVLQEGIPHRVVPNLVDVLFPLAGIPCVKIQRHCFAGLYRHILGKIMIQSRQQTFRRDGTFRFHTDTELPGVNASVCAGACLDVLLPPSDLIKGLLKDFLHGHGVFLDLPAVIMCAVVGELYEQISFHNALPIIFFPQREAPGSAPQTPPGSPG